MRILQFIFLGLVTLVCFAAIGVSAIMNWTWGTTLSAIPLYQNITGGIALVFDLIKVSLPIIGVIAISAGFAFSRLAKNTFMLFLSVASVWAAFLFLTSNRMDSFAFLKSQQENRVEVKDVLAEKIAEKKAIKKHRAFRVVDADYSVRCYNDKRKRWKSCKRLAQERSRALVSYDLGTEIAKLRKEKRGMKVVGTSSGGLGTVSDLFGISEGALSNIQALFTAIILEGLTGYVPAFVLAALFKMSIVVKQEKQDLAQKSAVIASVDPASGQDDKTVAVVSSSAQMTVRDLQTSIETDGEHAGMVKTQAVFDVQRRHETGHTLSGKIVTTAVAPVAVINNSATDYFREALVLREGSTLNSIALHGDYQGWCREHDLESQCYIDFIKDMAVVAIQNIGANAIDGETDNAAIGAFVTFRGLDVKGEKAQANMNPTIVPITA